MPEGSGSHIDYSENVGTQLNGTPQSFEAVLWKSCCIGLNKTPFFTSTF